MILAGADEAGKGALYGPGVICIVSIKENLLNQLHKIHRFKDSKLISRTRILYLYNLLKDKVDHKFNILTPREIDSTNLNLLLTIKYSELISSTVFDKAYIDCPLSSPITFIKQIYRLSKRVVESEHKADAKYIVTSLASIFAKAKRELYVEQIIMNTKIDIGSGYPSDPKTCSAYKQHYNELVPYLRTKWNIKNKLADK